MRQPQTLEVFVTEVCPAGEDSNLYMPFIQAPRTTNATTVPDLLPVFYLENRLHAESLHLSFIPSSWGFQTVAVQQEQIIL